MKSVLRAIVAVPFLAVLALVVAGCTVVYVVTVKIYERFTRK